MAKFLTELDVKLKRDRDDVWIVKTPLVYNSDIVGQVIVPIGFETDLSSVPRIPFIYAMWGARAHREGILHDLIFRSDSTPIVQWMVANNVFLEAMEVRGKPWYIRYPMYWGVCLGSWGYWHKRKIGDSL